MKNTLKNDFLSSRVRYIPLERIVPNPHQPRRDFDPAALAELADSIRQSCSLPRCVPGAGTMSWWPENGVSGQPSWRG